MAGPEATLEAEARRTARKMGIYTRKFTSPGHSGVPDRIFIYQGIVIFIEFKALDERPTPIQTREIKELLAQGVLATWVDNSILASYIFKTMKNFNVEELILLCNHRVEKL